MVMQLYTSETKPNGFTKKCRDCDKLIYLHRGTSDRWRAFEPAADGAASDEWIRHRCPAGLQDADLLSLIAPAVAKRDDLILTLKRLIKDFELMIAQSEAAREAAAVEAAAQEAARSASV
jgi:hypothetical protein